MHRDHTPPNALFLELSSTSRKFKGSRAATGKTARPVTIYGGSADEISKMNFSFLFESPQEKIVCMWTRKRKLHVGFKQSKLCSTVSFFLGL
jgi:hypothetical protein